MGREGHGDAPAAGRYCAGQPHHPRCDANPMQYLPLFLLLAAVLIAGWFYLQRAKVRDANTTTAHTTAPAADTVTTPPASDRPAD